MPSKDEVLIITSENGKAVFYVSNLSKRIYRRVDSEIKYSGCKKLISYVYMKSYKNKLEVYDSASFEEIEDCKDITYGNLELYCSDIELEFDFLKFAPVKTAVLDKEVVKKIQDMLFCATDEDTRYFMQSLFFSENGDIVATDGRKIAILKTDIPFGNWSIPKKAMEMFAKSKSGMVVSCYEENNKRWFILSDGDTYVISLENNGDYPKYQKVIPNLDVYKKVEFNIDFDYKKYKSFIKENHNKVVLIDNEIWCKDVKVGNFFPSTDPMIFNAESLSEILKVTNNTMYYRPVVWEDVGKGSGFGAESPCVTRVVMFGDMNDFFIGIMPMFNNSEISEEYIAKKKSLYA